MGKYQVCVRCVMDTTATEISFDVNGMCSFCRYFDKHIKPILERAEAGEGREILEQKVAEIKSWTR